MAADAQGNIRVVCRLRPMSDREKKTGTTPAVSASSERREVLVTKMVSGGTRQVRSSFHFDEVLTSFSTQGEVFTQTLDPLVDEVLSGYEATCFAYGQTGTGKTYTMEGDLSDEASRGLVPRAAMAMIDRLTSGGYADWAVCCQYLEIYNEELCDLFANPSNAPKLDLKDIGGGRGVACIGLSEVPVRSSAQIFDLLRSAQERRRVAETRINARSSRSHCIFTLKVRCRRAVASGELDNAGKLHLVDLAGSECAKKASSDEAAPYPGAKWGNMDEDRERKNINQSLLTLGRVISALRDGTSRVPYRDSKLTRLLKDALGGRSKTVIIATVSPALAAVEESISTLTYAEQAAGVKNRPVASSLLRTMRLADSRVALSDAISTSGGDFAELEMKVAYLTQEVEEAQGLLATKYREAQELLDRATKAEEELLEVGARLGEALRDGEEKAVVVARLEGFADDRCLAVSKLSGALDASTTHADDLRRRLEQSLAKASAGRRQARALVDAMEERGKEMSAEATRRSDALAALAGEAYSALEASSRVAASTGSEQRRVLTALASDVEGGARAADEALRGTEASAKERLEADGAAASQALDTLQASAREVSAAASLCAAEVDGAATAGEAVAEQRALAMREAAQGARQGIEERSTSAVAAASAAREAASQAHAAALQRVRGDLQSPLDELRCGLQNAVASLERHGAALGELRAGEGEAGAASAERWGQALAKLAAARESHAAASGSSRDALRAAIAELTSAVACHGAATDAQLSALAARLADVAADLRDGTQRSAADAAARLREAQASLVAAWASQGAALRGLGEDLRGAAARQREGSGAARVAGDTAAAQAELGASLGAAVEELSAVRDGLVEQVAELQQRRACEQELVGKLAAQREALKAHTSELRGSLDEVRTDLAKTRGELEALESAQGAARARLLEGVTALLRDGLEELAGGLAGAARGAEERLAGVEARLEAAASGAEGTEAASAEAVASASAVAARWSQSVGEGCGAIAAATERLARGADGVAAASQAAAGRLDGIAAAGARWGEACEEVAAGVDAADARRERLLEEVLQVEPQWEAHRSRTLEVVEAWAQDGRRAVDAFSEASSLRDEATAEFGKLREEVLRHKTAAEAGAEAWESSGRAHGATLAEVLEQGATCADGDRATLAARDRGLEERCAEAASLASSVAEHRGSCEGALSVVARHLGAMPGDFAASDAALADAAASIGEMTAAVGRMAEEAADGAEGLREAQVELAVAARRCSSAAATAIDGAQQAMHRVAAEQREASAASAAAQLAFWAAATASQRGLVETVASRCEAARAEEATAADAGSRDLAAEVQRADDARKRTMTVAEGMAAGVASALAADRRTVRDTLAAEPFSIFDEPSAAVATAPPRPEAAARPDVELLQRPSRESFLEDVRRTGGEEVVGKENDAGLRIPAAKLAGDAPIAKGKELTSSPGTVAVERKVLGVLVVNQA